MPSNYPKQILVPTDPNRTSQGATSIGGVEKYGLVDAAAILQGVKNITASNIVTGTLSAANIVLGLIDSPSLRVKQGSVNKVFIGNLSELSGFGTGVLLERSVGLFFHGSTYYGLITVDPSNNLRIDAADSNLIYFNNRSGSNRVILIAGNTQGGQMQFLRTNGSTTRGWAVMGKRDGSDRPRIIGHGQILFQITNSNYGAANFIWGNFPLMPTSLANTTDAAMCVSLVHTGTGSVQEEWGVAVESFSTTGFKIEFRRHTSNSNSTILLRAMFIVVSSSPN